MRCRHSIEVKSLRTQLKSSEAAIDTLKRMHKLELASLLERNTYLQDQAREKEALLQEVVANFKNMRGNLQSSYARVKTERDTLRKRIISLEMEQNKTGKHQDVVKGAAGNANGSEETKEVKRKKRRNKKGNVLKMISSNGD